MAGILRPYICSPCEPFTMKKALLPLLILLIGTTVHAQRVSVGLFGGISAYNGDLTEKIFPKKLTNGVVGITGNYEVTEQAYIRVGLTYTIVGGADRFSKDPALVMRNLAFETRIVEFSALGEYDLLNLYDKRFSPYVFGGLAVFHFNPYAYDVNKNQVFLRPLSTEGEGLLGYPDRKPYHLTQIAIPFGGGVKFALTSKIRIGLELGIRKLFTDYLDDVSKNYIDANDLLAAKGQLAVDMSYRSDEVGGDPNYPAKNAQRGSPKANDYYYFTGLHLTYKLGEGYNSKRSRTGCPANVY